MSANPANRVSSGERINITSEPGRLEQELSRRGKRLTRQRRTLLRIIDTAPRHLNVEVLLRLARRADPRLNRVTVYRTLDLLKREGLVDELDLLHLRGHQHYYETRGPRDHIHVACFGCGKVREVESELFDRLKQQIEGDCDMQITVARMEIGGYCSRCRRPGL
ncbi:MAG TPA: Fur family transcriptional regulator [Candidatus Dormibacteraeota bacterium]|nr:Fur family transcriptional regulator [Candidatus Dormibacteraeota bacterium]